MLSPNRVGSPLRHHLPPLEMGAGLFFRTSTPSSPRARAAPASTSIPCGCPSPPRTPLGIPTAAGHLTRAVANELLSSPPTSRLV